MRNANLFAAGRLRGAQKAGPSANERGPPGTHAFHGHEKGDCDGELAANPGKQHQVVTAPGITARGHVVANRAVIIHEGTDDLVAHRSGDAGHPIACGVITMK